MSVPADFCLIPIRKGGKKPAIDWKEFESRKPTPKEMERWQTELRPDAWGVVCGKVSGNLFIVDVDSVGAESTVVGRFIKSLGPTYTVCSSGMVDSDPTSGKRHYYLRDPTQVLVEAKGYKALAKKLDDARVPEMELKGEGGQVLVAGSKHPSGGTYTIINDAPVLEVSYTKVRRILDVIYRHWPLIAAVAERYKRGARHYEINNLGAFCFHHGFSEEDALILVRGVAYAEVEEGSSESEIAVAESTIHSTYERARDGQQVGYKEDAGAQGGGWDDEFLAALASLPRKALFPPDSAEIAESEFRKRFDLPEVVEPQVNPEVRVKPEVRVEPDKASEDEYDESIFELESASELVKKHANEELPWIRRPFFMRGEVTVLVGAANEGKTTLVLQMLYHGATGTEWFLMKKPGKPFRTLYFSLEAGKQLLAARLGQLFGENIPNIIVSTPSMLTLDDRTWDGIGKVVTRESIDVVVIDNLLGTDLGFDLNKMEGTTKFMNAARAFAKIYNVAIMLVHHTRKGGANDPLMNKLVQFNDNMMDEAAGSKVLVNRPGIRLFIQRRSNKRRLYVYSRFGPKHIIRMGWDKNSHKWRASSKGEEEGELQDEVKDELAEEWTEHMDRVDDDKNIHMDQNSGPFVGTTPVRDAKVHMKGTEGASAAPLCPAHGVLMQPGRGGSKGLFFCHEPGCHHSVRREAVP